MAHDLPDNIRGDWKKLTDKQRALIKEYLKTGNKLGSYKKVYDATPGKRSVKQNCYAEFAKPHIRLIIEQIQEAAVKASAIQVEDIIQDTVDDLIEQQKEIEVLKIDAFWILRRAALLADFNIKKFLRDDPNGNAVYDFSTASDDDWYCISEFTVDEINRGSGNDVYDVDRIKLKAHDKIRALELVSRFLPKGEDESDPLKKLTDAFREAFNEPSPISLD